MVALPKEVEDALPAVELEHHPDVGKAAVFEDPSEDRGGALVDVDLVGVEIPQKPAKLSGNRRHAAIVARRAAGARLRLPLLPLPRASAPFMDIAAFHARWLGNEGGERANEDPFLNDLCSLIGVPRPDPATGDPEKDACVYEKPAVLLHAAGKPTIGKIDLYREGRFLLEVKQASNTTKVGRTRRGTNAWHAMMSDALGRGSATSRRSTPRRRSSSSSTSATRSTSSPPSTPPTAATGRPPPRPERSRVPWSATRRMSP